MNGAMIRSPCNMSAARGSASEGFVNALDIKADQAVEHRLLHRDPLAYCAHPHLTAAKMDNWLLVFTQSLRRDLDRKSTRLNSSHTVISYAVFCLKKKTT